MKRYISKCIRTSGTDPESFVREGGSGGGMRGVCVPQFLFLFSHHILLREDGVCTNIQRGPPSVSLVGQ